MSLIQLTGLRGIFDLSSEQQNKLMQSYISSGSLSSDASIYDADRIYRNRLLYNKYGADTFYSSSIEDLDRRYYEDTLREQIYKFANPYVDDDPTKGFDENKGIGSDWFKFSQMSLDNQRTLLEDSNYKTPAEREKEKESVATPRNIWNTIANLPSISYNWFHGYGEFNTDNKSEDSKYFDPWYYLTEGLSSIGRLPTDTADAMAERKVQNKSNEALEKAYTRDREEKDNALAPYKEALMENLFQNADNQAIKDSFLQNLDFGGGRKHIFGAYFDKDGNPNSSEGQSITVEDMAEYLARKELYSQIYDEETAASMLENWGQDLISKRQGTWRKLQLLGADVEIGMITYAADMYNSVRRKGLQARDAYDRIVGNKTEVYLNNKGEVLPTNEVNANLSTDENGNLIYTNPKTGESQVVHKEHMSRMALDDLGLNDEGEERDLFNNVKYLNAMDMYKSANKEKLDEYMKLGHSSNQAVFSPGEDIPIWYETSKMASFILTDFVLSEGLAGLKGTGKGISNMGKGLSTKGNGVMGTVNKTAGTLIRGTGEGLYYTGVGLDKAHPFVAGLGIGEAYGRGKQQELAMENLAGLEDKAQQYGFNEVQRKIVEENGYRDKLIQRTEEIHSELVEEYNNELATSSEQRTPEQIEQDYAYLKEQAKQQTLNEATANEVNAFKNTNEYGKALVNAHEDASNAAAILAATVGLKYMGVNLWGWRKHLFKSQAKLAEAEAKASTQRVFMNDAGTATVASKFDTFWGRAKEFGKASANAFVGGAWTNATDELQSWGATQINRDSFSMFMNGMFDPEAEQTTMSVVDGFHSYFKGMGAGLAENHTYIAGLVGGLGAFLPSIPIGSSMVEASPETNKESWFEKNVFPWITNSAISNYYAAKQGERAIQLKAALYNKLWDEDKETLAKVRDLMALDIAKQTTIDQADQDAIDYLEGVASVAAFMSHAEDPEMRAIMERNPIVGDMFDIVEKLSDPEKLSNEERDDYISMWYRENPGIPRSEENNQEAIEDLSKRAKQLKEITEQYREVISKLATHEANTGIKLPDYIKGNLIYKLALQNYFFPEKIATLEEAITGNKEVSTNKAPAEAFGNREHQEKFLNVANSIVEEARSEQDKADEEAKSIIEKLAAYKGRELTDLEKQEAEKLNKSLSEAQKKAEYFYSLQLDILDMTGTITDRLSSEEGEKILTADEILRLEPIARAAMLRPDNRTLYSKEQQAEIQKLIKKLIATDPGLLAAIYSQARMVSYQKANNKSIEQIMSDPYYAAHHQETVGAAKEIYFAHMQEMFSAKLVGDYIQKAKDAYEKQGTYDGKIMSSNEEFNDAIFEYMKTRSTKALDSFRTLFDKGALPDALADHIDILDRAIEWNRFAESVVAAEQHNFDLDTNEGELTDAAIGRVMQTVKTKEEAIGALEELTNAKFVSRAVRENLRKVVDELKGIENQESAITPMSKEAAKKAKQDIRNKQKELKKRAKEALEEAKKKEEEKRESKKKEKEDKKDKEETKEKETKERKLGTKKAVELGLLEEGQVLELFRFNDSGPKDGTDISSSQARYLKATIRSQLSNKNSTKTSLHDAVVSNAHKTKINVNGLSFLYELQEKVHSGEIDIADAMDVIEGMLRASSTEYRMQKEEQERSSKEPVKFSTNVKNPLKEKLARVETAINKTDVKVWSDNPNDNVAVSTTSQGFSFAGGANSTRLFKTAGDFRELINTKIGQSPARHPNRVVKDRVEYTDRGKTATYVEITNAKDGEVKSAMVFDIGGRGGDNITIYFCKTLTPEERSSIVDTMKENKTAEAPELVEKINSLLEFNNPELLYSDYIRHPEKLEKLREDASKEEEKPDTSLEEGPKREGGKNTVPYRDGIKAPTYMKSMDSQLQDKTSTWEYYRDDVRRTKGGIEYSAGPSAQFTLIPAIHLAVDSGVINPKYRQKDDANIIDIDILNEIIEDFHKLGINSPSELESFIKNNQGKKVRDILRERESLEDKGESDSIEDQAKKDPEGVNYLPNGIPPSDGTSSKATAEGAGDHLLGNTLFLYDTSSIKNGILVPKQPRKADGLLAQWLQWLNSTGTRLYNIIDEELSDIAKSNPDVHIMYIKRRSGNDKVADTSLLAVKYTDEVARYHNKDNGGIFTAQDGEKYLLIGVLGYNGDTQMKLWSPINNYGRGGRDQYFSQHPEAGDDIVYVDPNRTTKIRHIDSGYTVKQMPGDLHPVSDKNPMPVMQLLNDEERNPQGYAPNELKWFIQREAGAITINIANGDRIHGYNPDNKGTVYLLIRGADGEYGPAVVPHVEYSKINNGKLKDKINTAIEKLASTDTATRKQGLNELRELLLLEEDHGGTRRRMNITVGDDADPVVRLWQNGVVVDSHVVNSTEFNPEVLERAIKKLPFIININANVLRSASLIEEYSLAGALSVDAANLNKRNAGFSVYPINSEGKAAIPESPVNPSTSTGTKAPATSTSVSTVQIGRIPYKKSATGKWTDKDGKEVTSPDVIKQLENREIIQKNNLQPDQTTKRAKYYIVNSGEHPVVIEVVGNNYRTMDEPGARKKIEEIQEKKAAAAREERATRKLKRNIPSSIDPYLADVYLEVKDIPLAVERLEKLEPEDIYEAASIVLSRNKLLWGGDKFSVGTKAETGFGEAERRKLFTMFASKENGGKSIQKLAEDEMLEVCRENGIEYDNGNARDALIELIRTAGKPSDITRYIKDRRKEEALKLKRDYEAHERAAEDEYYYANYGMSKEEYEELHEKGSEDLDEDVRTPEEEAGIKFIEKIQDNEGGLVLTPDGKFYTDKDGNLKLRVTSGRDADPSMTPFEDNAYGVPAEAVGNSMDEFGRDAFDHNLGNRDSLSSRYHNASNEDLNHLAEQYDELEDKLLGGVKVPLLDENGNTIGYKRIGGKTPFARDITLSGTMKVYDKKGNVVGEIDVAGTVDLVIMDRQGNFEIYDFKTYRAGSPWYKSRKPEKIKWKPSDSKQGGYNWQTTAYKLLFQQNGATVTKRGIIPMQTFYEHPNGMYDAANKNNPSNYTSEEVNGKKMILKENGKLVNVEPNMVELITFDKDYPIHIRYDLLSPEEQALVRPVSGSSFNTDMHSPVPNQKKSKLEDINGFGSKTSSEKVERGSSLTFRNILTNPAYSLRLLKALQKKFPGLPTNAVDMEVFLVENGVNVVNIDNAENYIKNLEEC